jgi:vancomycin resistance protein YoaR
MVKIRRSWIKILVKLFIVIGLLVFLMVDLLLIYSALYADKIFPNIYINNILVGGQNPNSAIKLIGDENKLKIDNLVLASTGKKYDFSPEQIKLSIDEEKTISEAFSVGRQSEFEWWVNIYHQIVQLDSKLDLNLHIDFDEEELDIFMATLSAEIDQPEIEPTISVNSDSGETEVVINKGNPGRRLDIDETKLRILNTYKKQVFNEVALAIIPINEEVTEEDINEAEKLANSLINKNLNIRYTQENWDVPDRELINFLSIKNTFEESKLDEWLINLAKTIDREPQNALFEFEEGIVKTFKPAKTGLTLDQELTKRKIKNAILILAKSNDELLDIELSITETEPEIATSEVNDLGIKKLIGYGESWFPHSIAGRIHNVDLASSKFHGVLIPPGETFSFNEMIGDIDRAHGYQSAYIIINGRTELGDGGGVCQVSTTMFRAALQSGLEIVERHAHAYRVSYYEVNSGPGIDATVYSPSPDIKFKNDTPGHILIQRVIDLNNLYLKFEFYGTDDGRVAEVSEPTIWSQTPPGPDIFQDDPTLPIGTVKQVDWQAWGAKVSFDWKVVRGEEVLQERTFYSNYKPWQNVYLKGTKEG